jgi:two-component system, NarL family, response regulator DesR
MLPFLILFLYCPFGQCRAAAYSSLRNSVKLRVVVADNHPGMLEYVASMLSHEFEVVAAVSDGAAAFNAVKGFAPEVAVLDLSMSPLSGLDVIRLLQENGSKTAFILVTGYTDPGLANAAFAAGAKGVVAKSRLAEDLIPVIHKASQNG